DPWPEPCSGHIYHGYLALPLSAEDVMKFRIVMVAGLVLAWTCGASAQQPGGRIDLERFAEEATRLVRIRAAFEEGTAVCPQDRTLLTISNGLFAQPRHSAPEQGPNHWRREHTAIDDETYRNQYGTNECRFDLLIRMQVLRDSSWASLLVPRV